MATAKTTRVKAGSAPKPARIAYPDVEPGSRAAWRAWLAANHETSAGVWLVNHKKGSGKPSLRYDDIVEECLCFGWVDSLVNKLDDERSRLLCTPRKPKSAWSRPNKERIERLVAAGAMAPRGLAAVALAKENGTWSKLDAVEDLVVPDDLARELAARPGARETWDAFPRSVKRGILEWIVQAKRPETRDKRVTETATLAARGERANQWRPKASS